MQTLDAFLVIQTAASARRAPVHSVSGESSSTWGDALTDDRKLGRRQTPSIRRQFQGMQSVFLQQGALQHSLDPILACAIYKREQMGVDSSELLG